MFEVACGRSEGAIKSASRTVTHDSGILWCSYDAVEAEVLTYLDRLSLFSVSSSFGRWCSLCCYVFNRFYDIDGWNVVVPG